MKPENSSFWSEIKKFEDTLAKDPSSYCFAPLAELYRKTGLLDDAISIAEKGSSLHPQYVGGYMALGRAYLDKGMKVEGREALQRVVKFTPENMLAQKLLCQIYMDSGENGLLRQTLESLLSLNAADSESRLLLESLDRIAINDNVDQSKALAPDAGSPAFVVEIDTEDSFSDDLEEIDLLEELEELVDENPLPVEVTSQLDEVEVKSDDTDNDNLSDSAFGIRTATIADLYAAQGHHEQALDIYRELHKIAPENAEYESRIEEIKVSIPGIDELSITLEDPWSPLPAPTIQQFGITGTAAPLLSEPEPEIADNDDQLTTILEGWLDSIRRLRECRSGKD